MRSAGNAFYVWALRPLVCWIAITASGMKPLKLFLILSALAAGLLSTGCSNASMKSPDVSGDVRHSLDSAGLRNVSVSQDRDKGVITISGHVQTDADKARAQSIAMSVAHDQVIANTIAVEPPGATSQARDINSDVDKGIEKNLDAALIQNNLNKQVRFDVKNGVITLKGEVDSEQLRTQAAQIAASVPYQQQIVNELQVKNQKATSLN